MVAWLKVEGFLSIAFISSVTDSLACFLNHELLKCSGKTPDKSAILKIEFII